MHLLHHSIVYTCIHYCTIKMDVLLIAFLRSYIQYRRGNILSIEYNFSSEFFALSKFLQWSFSLSWKYFLGTRKIFPMVRYFFLSHGPILFPLLHFTPLFKTMFHKQQSCISCSFLIALVLWWIGLAYTQTLSTNIQYCCPCLKTTWIPPRSYLISNRRMRAMKRHCRSTRINHLYLAVWSGRKN